MKQISLFILLALALPALSQPVDSTQLYLDSLDATLHFQTGVITFDSLGKVTVPDGLRYLDARQTEKVLTEWWGNPDGSGTMGMLVPSDLSLMAANSWAFILTYDPMGYVKDDDADDIDYEELLKEMQADTEAENEAREKEGYPKITLVGWAADPFYDDENKVLHWAKELQFGEGESNTLNYNVRMLGRKGVLIMNAVSTMDELPLVKANIEKVQASFEFEEGMQYKNFDPELDDVAAWTIGGLVAGKVLAKAGFIAILLKYIKVIGLALFALAGGVWKWIKGRREQRNPYADRGNSPTENS